MNRLPLLTLLAAGIFLVGCASIPLAPTERTEIVVKVSDYEALVDHALAVLRSHQLEPSYIDRTSGLVLTDRITSGQPHEVWRSDVYGTYQTWEALLNTIGREARVELVRTDGEITEDPIRTIGATEPSASGEYRVSVEVQKSRYQTPTRQITTVTGALGLFSERLPTDDGLRGIAIRRASEWKPLGRDGELERVLLNKIRNAPGVRSGV